LLRIAQLRRSIQRGRQYWQEFRTRGSAGGGGASLLGYYHLKSAATPPPDPTPANYPAATSKFDDVGVGDETTYESGNGGGEITVMLALAAPAVRSGYTAKIWYEAPNVYVAYYWDGAAWVVWGAAAAAGNFGHQWTAVNEALGAQNAQYFAFVFDDVGTMDPPDGVRVGDWRVS
jgi:hypothetical protein